MAYPTRLLNDHETVAVDLHPHWWYFAGPTLAMLLSICAAVATLVVTEAETTVRTIAGVVSLAALLCSACWVVVRYTRWITTHFVITNQRVIFRAGMVAKRGVEIPLERITTVHFRQGIFQRLVGTGDLVVESGSEWGLQTFTDIRQPDRVQRVIHAQMDVDRARFAGATAGHPDVAGQLERLEGMLERGTLTPEEFARQKQRLLGE